MISPESILAVTCPRCGAGPGAPCAVGSKGKLRSVQHPARIGRALDERAFWRWIDERLSYPENAHLTEQQFLDSIRLPGWTGRKARTKSPAPRVIEMLVHDHKRAAAGDIDDAA
jgi:hypothetical protein